MAGSTAPLTASRVIEAAGGVLWRPAGTGLEIAVVHRPKYDDWSLPKGKLARDEHPVLGATREVLEETGYVGVPGRPMGETHYLKDSVPKRVRYWAMRVEDGSFAPNAEVDELRWLAPEQARELLLPERDRGILDDVDLCHVATWPCAIVRHASAGERSAWKGADRERPLDQRGHEQAIGLVPLLAAYRISRVVSADVLRCTQTIVPLATRLSLDVESEPLLSEVGYAGEPEQTLARMLELVDAGDATAVCSSGRRHRGRDRGAHRAAVGRAHCGPDPQGRAADDAPAPAPERAPEAGRRRTLRRSEALSCAAQPAARLLSAMAHCVGVTHGSRRSAVSGASIPSSRPCASPRWIEHTTCGFVAATSRNGQ